jgi:uncharacterized protein (DUF885 family)
MYPKQSGPAMTMMLKFRLGLMLALLPASATCVLGQSADQKLDAFFRQYLEDYFRLRPLEATRLGDHRFDSLIENLTPESRAAWLDQIRKAAADLPRQVEYARLSRPAQIDFEILEHDLNYQLWLGENTHPYEEDPRIYNDYINDSVYLLLTQSTLPLETNVANAIARMALIPKTIAAARQNLHNPPRVNTETAIRQNRGAIAFYESDIYNYAGKTRQSAALKAAADSVVSDLKQYQTFLETDLLPRANGEWRLGPDKFAHKLDLELEAGVTADDVLTNAEAEFGRVQDQMFVIARQLWSRYYFKEPLPPDDEIGRRATVQIVLDAIGKEHDRPENLARDMRLRVIRLKQFIRATDFVALPEPDRTKIIVMPEFRRGDSTAYMEAAPPLDTNATGLLAISPPPGDWNAQQVNSYMEEYNDRMLDVLTIHEGYPGHAVQFAYGNLNPSLIRRVLPSGTYVEGWAVYTEKTMVDQGYGGGDLALRLTQLKFYLRAVANAILDHKMHCGTMTDDQALDFLTRQCYQSEGEARLKIIRAEQTSCQLSTYFVGRMAHYRLRQEIERQMGDKFSLSAYHHAVLVQGAVPVKYLPELVRTTLGLPH